MLTILVGIPGAGKSSWAAANNLDSVVVAADLIRAELGVDYTAKGNRITFREFHRRVRDELAQGSSVIADATHLDPRSRRPLYDMARAAGAGVRIVWFSNAEAALVRNEARADPVPDDAMRRMVRRHEQAGEDLPVEGWPLIEINK